MSMPNISAISDSSTVGGRTAPVSAAPSASVTRSTVQVAESSGPTAAKPTAAELDKAIETLNKFVSPMAKSVSFSLDNSTGTTVVKVTDTEKNELISQFPSEEALSLMRSLDKLQGLLVTERA